MMTWHRLGMASPIAVAIGFAAAWPVTAYAFNPLLLPGVLAIALACALALRNPAYGVALALILAPFLNLTLDPTGAPTTLPTQPVKVLLSPLVLMVLLYGLLISRQTSLGSVSRSLALAVGVFVIVVLISAIQALDPSASVSKLVLILTAAALFFAVREVCTGRHELFVVVNGAMIGLLLTCAHALGQYYSGSFSQEAAVAGEAIGRIQSAFPHPNQFAGFVAPLIPVGIAVGLSAGVPASTRRLARFATALAVPALVLSFTRGAIVALVLGAILWLAFLRPRWAVAAAAIATVIALITAPATLRERFDPEETAGELPLRSDIWGSALDIYAEHPLTGVGVNNFGAAYERLPSVSASASQRRLLHNEQLLIPPHAQNLYLNVLAELGPLGVLALLALLIASVQIAYRGARIRDPGGRAVCIGVGAGLSVLLLHSLVEVTLMNEVVIPVFALTAVAAGFLALDRSEDEAGETATVQTANGG